MIRVRQNRAAETDRKSALAPDEKNAFEPVRRINLFRLPGQTAVCRSQQNSGIADCPAFVRRNKPHVQQIGCDRRVLRTPDFSAIGCRENFTRRADSPTERARCEKDRVESGILSVEDFALAPDFSAVGGLHNRSAGADDDCLAVVKNCAATQQKSGRRNLLLPD